MNKRQFIRGVATLAAAGVAGFPFSSIAQSNYPSKPIRVIVPFLAGGSIDLIIRLMNEKLGERLGQPMIVENRAGAGGMLGANVVAKSDPDGYTLLFSVQGPIATTPFLIKDIPYDARTAFAPVSMVTLMPNVLLVHPSLPVKTLREFIDYAKANPGKLTYGSQGIGTTGHLTGAMVNQYVGINLVHVPYKGFPPLLADVKTGRVNMMFVDTVNALPRIRAHELVPLAVSGEQRSSSLPDIPTFREAGYPQIISEPWFAMFAPAGTPLAIRKRVSDEIRVVLKDPKISGRLKDLGVEIKGSTPEELGVAMKKEYDRWGPVIRAAGLRPK
jgi:tripartite-type tricarboxylate transporter receptor subunit TctC